MRLSLLAPAAALRYQHAPRQSVSPIRASSNAPRALDDAIIVEPAAEHIASVVFLHGLGDTGDGWASLMPELDRLLPPACTGRVRWVLPHAPQRPIALNQGMHMPGWFDVVQLAPDAQEDTVGLEAAAARVASCVEREVEAGTPRNKVIVGGFSQGGAVALHVALRSPEPLAGCISLCSWLPLRESYPAALGGGAAQIPFLIAHGDADMVVPYSWSQLGHQKLRDCGLNVRMIRAIGVGHGVDASVLREVGRFLGGQLGG
eukprot:scaffold69791_cov30-Tisochrysis_lutea.AAC.3